MTEAEWFAATDPRPMQAFLRDKVSDRKVRLFAVGCCRQIWSVLKDERSQNAVVVAEQYADGLATQKELARVQGEAIDAATNGTAIVFFDYLSLPVDASGKRVVLGQLMKIPGLEPPPIHARFNRIALIRDIFGNPFRPIVADPAWLTPTVRAIASAIYADRAFDRLPILADALEEAGCTNADILLHCRMPEDHVRGCWVVDLVLGKD